MAAISDHVTSVVWRSDLEVGRRVNLEKLHDFDIVLKKGKSGKFRLRLRLYCYLTWLIGKIIILGTVTDSMVIGVLCNGV